jgi:SNF2 family DNA or RNA helicase
MKDLPQKVEEVITCSMTPVQESAYLDLLSESKQTFSEACDKQASENPKKKKSKQPEKGSQVQLNNILMQLRKMSCK